MATPMCGIPGCECTAQAFRDDFDASLDPAWLAFNTAPGLAPAVAASILTLDSVAAGGVSRVSRSVSNLPITLDIRFLVPADLAGAPAPTVRFGFYDNVNPAVATEFVEWSFTTPSAVLDATASSRGGANAASVQSSLFAALVTLPMIQTPFGVYLESSFANYRYDMGTAQQFPASVIGVSHGFHLPKVGTPLFLVIEATAGLAIEVDAVVVNAGGRPWNNPTF